MSQIFRELLKKIAGGEKTSFDLTREEAKKAAMMILLEEATPAQIGAFLIAHRMKRPTGEELAGFLDAYEELGPQIDDLQLSKPLLVLANPHEGRSRTVPINVLTSLALSALAVPNLMHGGESGPPTYGYPAIDMWRLLGIDWSKKSFVQMTEILKQHSLGFLYVPTHFSALHGLTRYRDEIGKRTPFSSAELIWAPYKGEVQVAGGYVHRDTSEFLYDACQLRGIQSFALVLGVEGSSDLPRSRTAYVTFSGSKDKVKYEASEYNCGGKEVALMPSDNLGQLVMATLAGKDNELTTSLKWNLGFYLFWCGKTRDLRDGLLMAEETIKSGLLLSKRNAIAAKF